MLMKSTFCIKSEKNIAKPVVKWAGGKRGLLSKFDFIYPARLKEGNISRYVEPFVGGGAVFFDIYNKYNIDEAVLMDINPEIIILYNTIKERVDDLIMELSKISESYFSLEEAQKKEFFYKRREEYNCYDKFINANLRKKEDVKRSALTLFLNKTCFNGLYRVNKKGFFNVPFGRYKKPKILDESRLKEVSKAFQIATIIQGDFEKTNYYAGYNTFIYYDPPYKPINKTSSFKSYSKENFDDFEQHRLKDLFCEVSKKGALQMLSNSDPMNFGEDPFFDELYKDYNIMRVFASRSINSNANERGLITELVIRNY